MKELNPALLLPRRVLEGLVFAATRLLLIAERGQSKPVLKVSPSIIGQPGNKGSMACIVSSVFEKLTSPPSPASSVQKRNSFP
mmetsp:Transcript_17230/g.19941  ORF Transcript_17230/g.19941 Transcript_17230/m.19941 type:complete len:83 (+) Transcript_17230:476-724(+)